MRGGGDRAGPPWRRRSSGATGDAACCFACRSAGPAESARSARRSAQRSWRAQSPASPPAPARARAEAVDLEEAVDVAEAVAVAKAKAKAQTQSQPLVWASGWASAAAAAAAEAEAEAGGFNLSLGRRPSLRVRRRCSVARIQCSLARGSAWSWRGCEAEISPRWPTTASGRTSPRRAQPRTHASLLGLARPARTASPCGGAARKGRAGGKGGHCN